MNRRKRKKKKAKAEEEKDEGNRIVSHPVGSSKQIQDPKLNDSDTNHTDGSGDMIRPNSIQLVLLFSTNIVYMINYMFYIVWW